MPPAKKRPVRRRRGPGWKEYLLAMALTVGTGLAVGLYVGGAFSANEPMATIGHNLTSGEPAGTTTASHGFSLLPHMTQPMNVLVMACDVNYTYKDGKKVMGLNGNTDSMILVRFDPAQDQIRMLSIPRDTRVPIEGHGTFKINAANPYGGPALAARTVADFLHVTIDRYLLFNTRAVIELVDAMGGLNVYVPERMHYNDYTAGLHINFQKGLNHMDGQKAHDFLRFRHDELGDIGRIQRNQAFLQAVIHQYVTPMNLLKTPQLLSVAKENLQTNLTDDELMQLAGWAKDLNKDHIQFAMVPGVATDIAGVSYWVADPASTQRVVDSFLTAEQAQTAKAPATYRIAIRDGIGDRLSAHQLKRTLQLAGYNDVRMDGLASQLDQPETQIIAQTADIAGAKALADKLGVGKVVVAATGNIYTDFTVVIGRDWLARASQQAGAR